MFRVNEAFPGIRHITDAMGVSFTLIEGTERAVLFDTGYGMENVAELVRSMTNKPVKVLLSHGHHDHMLGARWFSHAWMCSEDLEEFRERTGSLQRSKVIKQAEQAGVTVPQDYMDAEIPLPETIRFMNMTDTYDSVTENLGDQEITLVKVPGHTPGSIVIHIPAYRVLLTADNWNPCTWMWFPSSLGADEWRDNMLRLISALEADSKRQIEKVICSHQPMVREGSELKKFLEYMTDERMKEALPVNMGAGIDTHQIEKGEWTLIFDRGKLRC